MGTRSKKKNAVSAAAACVAVLGVTVSVAAADDTGDCLKPPSIVLCFPMEQGPPTSVPEIVAAPTVRLKPEQPPRPRQVKRFQPPATVAFAGAEVLIPKLASSGRRSLGADGVPENRISALRRFRIARNPVTVGEFQQYCRETGTTCDAARNRPLADPITGVSKLAATAYLKWLSSKGQSRYRLPFHAELVHAFKNGLVKGGYDYEWAQDEFNDGKYVQAIAVSNSSSGETEQYRFTIRPTTQSDDAIGFRVVIDANDHSE